MTPDMSSISWWIAQLGPSGIVIFIAWRVLLFFKPIVLELVPYVKDLLTGHVRLMNVMETQLANGAVTLKKVSDTQDGHGVMIKEIHSTVVK